MKERIGLSVFKKVLLFSLLWILLVGGLYLGLQVRLLEERDLDAKVLEEESYLEPGASIAFSYPADERALEKLIQFFLRPKSYQQNSESLKKEIESWRLSQEDSVAEISGGGAFEEKKLVSLSFHLRFQSNQLAQKFKAEVFKRLHQRGEGVEQINEQHIQASFGESQRLWLIHDGHNVIDLQYENFSSAGQP